MPDAIARVWSGSAWVNISSIPSIYSYIPQYSNISASNVYSGESWFNSNNNFLYIWNGLNWKDITTDLSNYAKKSSLSNIDLYPKLTTTSISKFDINTQTASYLLKLSDAGKLILMTASSSTILRIPNYLTASFNNGTRIDVVQYGDGQITFSPESSVTINSSSGQLKTMSKYSAASLIKTDTNKWVVTGGLTL